MAAIQILSQRKLSLSCAYQYSKKNSPVTFSKQLSTYGQYVFQAKSHYSENQSNPLVQLVQKRAEIWNLIGEYFSEEERRKISQTSFDFRNRFRKYPLDQELREALMFKEIRKSLKAPVEILPRSALYQSLEMPYEKLPYHTQKQLENTLVECIKASSKSPEKHTDKRRYFTQLIGKLPHEEFYSLFKKACKKGAKTITSIALEDVKFQSTSRFDLEEAFRNACQNGHEEVVLLLSGSTRFQEISSDDLGFGLRNASQNGHQKIISFLLKTKKFHEVSSVHIGWAYYYACLNHHLGTASLLFENQNPLKISRFYFQFALQSAEEKQDNTTKATILDHVKKTSILNGF